MGAVPAENELATGDAAELQPLLVMRSGAMSTAVALLGLHDPVEFVPVLMRAAGGDEDPAQQHRKLQVAEVLDPVVRPEKLDRPFHGHPVRAVAKDDRCPAARPQMAKLAGLLL